MNCGTPPTMAKKLHADSSRHPFGEGSDAAARPKGMFNFLSLLRSVAGFKPETSAMLFLPDTFPPHKRIKSMKYCT